MPEVLGNEQIVFSSEQYRTLLEVAEIIAVHRDLRELFDDLAQRLPPIVPFDYINLVLHDPTRNVMRLHILVVPEKVTIREGMEFPVDESPGGLVWKSQQPLVVEDAEDENRFPQLTPLLLENGVHSYCVVPLTTALRRLGAMGFGSKQKRIYQESELSFMEQVAKQVAVAVDNVLHEEGVQAAQQQLRHERDRVQLLLEVNNAMVSHLSLDDLFPAVSACLRKVIPHDGAGLALFDQETGRYRVHVLLFDKNESFIQEGLTEAACTGPSNIAMSTRKPAALTECDLKNLCVESPIAQQLLDKGVRAFCSIPLLSHDRVLGALNIGRSRDDAFRPDEIDLLSEVAKQVALAVENAQSYRQIIELKDQLAKEKHYLQEEIRTEHNFDEIVGESSALRRVLKEVETVAPTDSTVLIRGETGTGKELIARALHELSPRRERTFVKINCAAIPTGLLESELFGHEKGAFTGAISQKVGRFELAHLGDVVFSMRWGTFRRSCNPNCCACCRSRNSNDWEARKRSRWTYVWWPLQIAIFRRWPPTDNFAAISTTASTCSRLPCRRCENAGMTFRDSCRHFAQKLARRMGRRIETIPSGTLDALVQYSWPGNIRELENVIERAVILSPGLELHVNLNDLKSAMPQTEVTPRIPVTLNDAEREHILDALRNARWVLGGPNGAAARLAMKRTTLQSKMKKLGIERPQQ